VLGIRGFLPAGVAIAAAAALVAPSAGASVGTGRTVWVAQSLCARSRPGLASCDGVRLVARKVATDSTLTPAERARPFVAAGPSGGFSPAELAAAYGVSVSATAAANQTVALVDAFDDPTVKSDLNTFDANYGIPAETSTSFRVVNQTGGAILPGSDPGWAGEITLDVQAVRGLCRKCKILLVETNSNSEADLAAGVNEAVALHATEVSNSYGVPETDSALTPTVAAAYDHRGVVITASTGDDGWYGWDAFNSGAQSDNVPQAPAALSTVVGVGGTSLYLNPDGTRASERVWNSNGPYDYWGYGFGGSPGSAGGGCSTRFTARMWQQKIANYATLGCGSTKRSATDIAAVADPFTGYDIFQTFGKSQPGWETMAGTSLASPVVAAMWALAGGAGGAAYPALSLYGHFKSDTVAHTYDVVVGGNGLCDTASTTKCFQEWGGNPNTLGHGMLDCAWAASGSAVLANHAQCYARPGYDGVSGVGTPMGSTVFTAMSPKAVIVSPGTVTHNVSKTFSSSGTTDPFPGGSITTYSWNWGDGNVSTGASPTHTYTSAGTRTITLTVTDNYGRTGKTTRTITVT
jgi:hypothetical protein